MSKEIYIYKSTLKGNVVIVADQLRIESESTVMSQNAGCNFFGDIKGIPSLFVSHSFSCGLNAGSYGGRGGIGIADTKYDTLECIKNAYARMSVYGNPLMPTSSGSTGSPYTIQEKNGFSPGAIAIISDDFILSQDSKIFGGYSDEYKGTPASSGGSISIIARNATLKGKVTANGQSTDKDMSGEGGGGRISLYKVCWWNASTPETNEYNFEASVFEAAAGRRPEISNETLRNDIKEYMTFIRAETGCKL